MITAKEAAEIAGPCAADYLKFLEEKIKDSAKKNARSVCIREEPYARWLYSKPSKEAEKTMEVLKTNGFQLEHYYKEHSIAVDMGLIIKW